MLDPKLWTRRSFLASATSAALLPSFAWADTEQSFSNATLVMPDGSIQAGGLRCKAGRITALGQSTGWD